MLTSFELTNKIENVSCHARPSVTIDDELATGISIFMSNEIVETFQSLSTKRVRQKNLRTTRCATKEIAISEYERLTVEADPLEKTQADLLNGKIAQVAFDVWDK